MRIFFILITIFSCTACDPTTTITIPLDRKSVTITFPCNPQIQHKKNKNPDTTDFILYFCDDSNKKVFLLTQTVFSKKSFEDYTQSEFLDAKVDRLAHEGFPEKLISIDKTNSPGIEAYLIKKRYFNPSRFLVFKVFLDNNNLFHATYGDMLDTFSVEESRKFLDSVKIVDYKIY